MKQRLAAILITGIISWSLIEETAAPLINGLLESRTAGFIQTLFHREKVQEPELSESTPEGKPGGIDQWIEEAASLYALNPDVIRAVIEVESGGDPNAVSIKGAQGLMQLMPETCKMLGVEDPFDSRQNILGGAMYLRDMLDEFGGLDLALAAYNAGPSAVREYGGIPPYPETQEYVQTVKANLDVLKQGGITAPP